MKIFIDEAGTFVGGEDSSVSVVGALVVPGRRFSELLRKYALLRQFFPLNERGEVKGRALDEVQIKSVVKLLIDHEVLAEFNMFDGNMVSQEQLTRARLLQAEKLTASLTVEHHPELRKGLDDLTIQLQAMANQLYVQFAMTTMLIHRVLSKATLYFSQRRPNELGSFSFVVDGKASNGVTRQEEWWQTTVMPFIQSISLRDPIVQLVGADYRSFKRFEAPIPEHLRPHLKDPTQESGLDIRKMLMEDFRFSSDIEPGLELVDIVVTAVRRALKGHLAKDGWSCIPDLVIGKRDQQCIHILHFDDNVSANVNFSYANVLSEMGEGRKQMLVSSWSDRRLRRMR